MCLKAGAIQSRQQVDSRLNENCKRHAHRSEVSCLQEEVCGQITGNLWPLERLAPCKLPHGSHVDNLVVLSSFATFLNFVPKEPAAT